MSLALLAAGCQPPEDRGRLQGYFEGEFVYVAAPLGGRLVELNVARGDQVQPGTPLFALDDVPELAARDQAQRALDEAQATLEDLTKGRRPTEIDSLEAQLRQAQSGAQFDERELKRQEALERTHATSAEAVDRARSLLEQARQRVAQLEAELATAQLGARTDQVAAAQERVRGFEAALERAEWNLAQKKQVAQRAGEVTDTLFRAGEWVAPERPVVVMLPPENIKLRTFVPQAQVARIHRGDKLRVWVDGVEKPLEATVSFIAPKAEYTPPVIYSQQSRDKLVFLVEAVFDAAVARALHPGQPVDVELMRSSGEPKQ